MDELRIPRRVSTAVLSSLRAGVVPRIGLPYIAVGRKQEIQGLVQDLDNIRLGGASFRLVIGRYGSGKSFLLQLIRNYALDQNFVVVDCDLSPERRLAGRTGQGLATYRELMQNISIKTRPEGGALAAVLERWISNVQAIVAAEGKLKPTDQGFSAAVEAQIFSVINNMEEMVHGFDFAKVLASYWQGYVDDDDLRKNAALRWLRGEYATKTEARADLGVRVIINDDTWYDYLKLLARFVSEIGYSGLLVLVDEAVNLYKISHSITRQYNYEKILTMFNDTMQGRVQHLGIILGGTPQFLDDERRGLFSYDALRTRLSQSRFGKPDHFDASDPVIRLQPLNQEEVFLLLQKIAQIHQAHFGYDDRVSDDDLVLFMQTILNYLGVNELLTPRDVVKDLLSLLAIAYEQKNMSLAPLIDSPQFRGTLDEHQPDDTEDDDFAEFTL